VPPLLLEDERHEREDAALSAVVRAHDDTMYFTATTSTNSQTMSESNA